MMRINITSGQEGREASKSHNQPPTRRTQPVPPLQPIPPSPALRHFLRQYRKEVELPISYQTSIHEGRGHQRCMSHNSPLTQYCAVLRQPLCQHCSPSGQSATMPLGQAHQPLSQELAVAISSI